MARDAHDREDLLAEATGLVERAELEVAGEAEPVVAGFRRDGSASIYFGGDPVYQFNTALELRRAFVEGLLYKSERRQLASLRRQRTGGEVVLARDDLDAPRQAAFLARIRQRLDSLHGRILAGQVRVLRQVPTEADLLARIRGWLDRLPAELPLAQAPGLR